MYNSNRITDDLDFMQATATPEEIARFRLRRGDVIITKDSESPLDIGVPASVEVEADALVCGYHLTLLRPKAGQVLGGYLAWALRSAPVIGQFSVRAQGVTRFGLTWFGQADIRVPVPPTLDEQTRIAEMLAAETTRLDQLVSVQSRILEVEDERSSLLTTKAISDLGAPVKRLKYVVPEITVGIVVTPSAYYVSSGVPAFRSLNVRPMELGLGSLVFISDESNELHAKSRLRAGDVVAVRTGKPGTAAVVPPGFDGANCIDLIIMRQSRDLDPSYLAYVLNSDIARHQFALGSEGAIQRHFNIGTARNLRIPVPSLSDQRRTVADLDARLAQARQAQQIAFSTMRCLRERRAALVTALVTGQLAPAEAREAA